MIKRDIIIHNSTKKNRINHELKIRRILLKDSLLKTERLNISILSPFCKSKRNIFEKN